MTKYSYGRIPDKVDTRDWLYCNVHKPTNTITYPDHISLRDKFKEAPYDQGQLGSCTGQSSIGAFTFEHGGGPYSRLAQYYWTRELEGTVATDSGAQIRDAVKVLADSGAGLEADWPYDTDKFADEPPAKEVQEAAANKLITYSSLVTPDDFKTCLVDGFPFIFGAAIYDSFETDEVASTGIVPTPGQFDQVIGGHAICCIGFKHIFGELYYEVRNSWGTSWGDGGYCWFPAAYMEDRTLVNDCWTLRK